LTQHAQQYRDAVYGIDAPPAGEEHDRPGRDVLLVADAEQIATEAGAAALLESRAPRAYAFLRSGQRLDTLKRLCLRLLFGPILWQEARPEGPRAAVRVAFVQPDVGGLPRTKTPLERKRLHVWHADRRNDFLAALADALARRDRARLGAHGLFLGAEGDGFFAGPAPAVTVLVEAPEHGRELAERLPGWALWDAVPRQGQAAQRAVGPFAVGPLHRVILTLVEASRLRDNDGKCSLDTDVLVRADGTGWPLGLEGLPPRTSQADREVLLVDLADDQDEEARAATRRRLRGYRRRGWDVQGAPAWLRQEQG
jgi:hypothetical protein